MKKLQLKLSVEGDWEDREQEMIDKFMNDVLRLSTDELDRRWLSFQQLNERTLHGIPRNR